jgi:hypothetical protein
MDMLLPFTSSWRLAPDVNLTAAAIVCGEDMERELSEEMTEE